MANDIVKIGLIAGGAYLVSKYVFGFDPLAGLFGGSTTITTTTTGPGTPVNTGGGTSTSPQGNSPTAANTLNQVIAAFKASGGDPTSMQTFDTWNYFYQQVRGIAGPDPGQYLSSADRQEKMSVQEWWSFMIGAGFSGMGMIAHRINPYQNVWGTPYGDNLAPLGFEKYAIYRN
jgi:hypothetical protein